MVESPSIKVTSSQLRINLSEPRLAADTRVLNMRRSQSMAPPIRHMTPKMEPAQMAIIWCVMSDTPSARKTLCGVSSPTAWPKKMAMMPMWNRLLASRMLALDSNWLESLFQVYCSRSKRITLPTRNTVSAMYG